MSRYRGPKIKVSRRLGILPGLTLKKSNRFSQIEKSNSASKNRGKKLTEYGLRLQEKQKLKFNYGLTEQQLFKYVKEAKRKRGVTGLILLQLLEMRLDAICFALGFGKTIAQSRQIITHGNITVNSKLVNIPSFQCSLNDVIGMSIKSKIKPLIKENLKYNKSINKPSHLKLNDLKLEAVVLDYCKRDDISLKLDELLIIEYYSRH